MTRGSICASLGSPLVGGNPDAVTGALGCLLVLTFISLVRARSRTSAAVRSALSDPDPETRRAAVLVAARHGLSHHARLLLGHARREEAGDVLFALAEVVRDRGCFGHGSRAKLRRWSEAFLSVREPSGSGDRKRASPHGCSGPDPVLACDVIDALQVFDAVEPPALPTGGAKEAHGPAPVWTAAPDELDPLAVLGSLEGRPAPPPSRRDWREPGHRRDHEALVDRLAGIAPGRRAPAGPRARQALTDRPGGSGLSEGVQEAATA